MAVERVDGGVQGHGADDVGGAGLFPIGRVGPDHLVEVDEVHGAAAGQEWVALGEGAPWADEHSGAEGGVHLVAAPGEEVRLGGQGRWAASWAASTSTGMPRAWAASMSSSSGAASR